MSGKKPLRLFVMDVDGTLTDGGIYIGAGGEMMKAFHVRDGYAIVHMLPELGIVPVIITGRESEIVRRRAAELHITELHQGIGDKLTLLREIARRYQVTAEQVAYIGDDLNDLECMNWCGFSACPGDACPAVKAAVHYVSPLPGGRGAVRDVIEKLME